MRVLPAGDRHLLVDLATDPADPAVVAARARGLDGIVDALPAASTVLVSLAVGADADALRLELARVAEGALTPDDQPQHTRTEAPTSSEVLEIPVVYDGDDLGDVAHLLGTDREDVIARHTGQLWRCSFLGFAPGFGYLVPDQPSSGPSLAVPRRPQSRTTVPAGSVALADGYSAVYPRSTPGGWQLIGRTQTLLWDVTRDQPALLPAGVRVRFTEAAGGAR